MWVDDGIETWHFRRAGLLLMNAPISEFMTHVMVLSSTCMTTYRFS